MEHTEQKRRTSLFLYVIISLAATAVAVLLRTVDLLCFYDKEIGYYTHGAVLPVVYRVFVVAALLFFLILPLAASRKKIFTLCQAPAFAVRAAMVPCVCFFAFAAVTVADLFQKEGEAFVQASRESSAFMLLTLVLILLSVAAGAYFLAFFLSGRKVIIPPYFLVLGLCAILWTVLVLGISYFDMEVGINTPGKLSLHLACLSVMLLILGEIRCAIGYIKPCFYLFSLSSAALLCCAHAIPSVIALFCGRIQPYALLRVNYVLIAIGFYAIVRLLLIHTKPEKSVLKTVDRVRELVEQIYGPDHMMSADASEEENRTDDTQTAPEAGSDNEPETPPETETTENTVQATSDTEQS